MPLYKIIYCMNSDKFIEIYFTVMYSFPAMWKQEILILLQKILQSVKLECESWIILFFCLVSSHLLSSLLLSCPRFILVHLAFSHLLLPSLLFSSLLLSIVLFPFHSFRYKHDLLAFSSLLLFSVYGERNKERMKLDESLWSSIPKYISR